MAGGDDLATDAALARAALTGDQSAYAALMRRHREAVFRLARHHAPDDAAAIDITQEAFIAAFAALRRFDGERPFRAWILRIALNKCRDHSRWRKVRHLVTFARPIEEAIDVADPSPDPETALQSARAVCHIRREVQALPARLREPLVLCAIEGMSQDEAAELLGVSRKAIETRIYRARQKLSQLLEG
jgi:RNA polymerase sigma-70 factor (ECF subfamily)